MGNMWNNVWRRARSTKQPDRGKAAAMMNFIKHKQTKHTEPFCSVTEQCFTCDSVCRADDSSLLFVPWCVTVMLSDRLFPTRDVTEIEIPYQGQNVTAVRKEKKKKKSADEYLWFVLSGKVVKLESECISHCTRNARIRDSSRKTLK